MRQEGEERTFTVKVNGKRYGEFIASWKAHRDDLIAQARVLVNVQRVLRERELRRVVVVPGRLVNFVVR